MTVSTGDLQLDWLGYATLRLAGPETTVYLDPGRYGVLTGQWEPVPELGGHPPAQDYTAQDGDVVFVTHIHHYDPDGIRRVAAADATVVCFEGIDVGDTDRDVVPPAELPYETRFVTDSEEGLVDGVPFFTVPAYNDEENPSHPPGFGCGYLVTVAGRRVFWPGDTDVLPGHSDLSVDVLTPPISGRITMEPSAAAELAVALEPALAVPVHYNTFPGLAGDEAAFVEAVAGAGVPVALDVA